MFSRSNSPKTLFATESKIYKLHMKQIQSLGCVEINRKKKLKLITVVLKRIFR